MRWKSLLALSISIILGFSYCTQQSDADLLTTMRERLGAPEVVDGFKVSALAECSGPDGSAFTTLVISDASNTRFEQISGDRHTIGLNSTDKKGWFSMDEGEALDLDSTAMTFLTGHELHLIAYFPESRFGESLWQQDTVYHDQQAIQLNFKDLLGARIRVYYDKANLWPLGFTIFNHLGRGAPWIDTLFDDWEEQEGMMVFKSAQFIQGSDIYQYRFTNVKFTNLEEGVFENYEAHLKGP